MYSMVKEDRERSERENFLALNFSFSQGWGPEGLISRGLRLLFSGTFVVRFSAIHVLNAAVHLHSDNAADVLN